MADSSTVEQKLIEILSAYADDDARITANTNFMADLTLESVRVLEFIVEVEDEFDINIDMDSLSDIHTVGDLAAVVTELKSR